jgi:hypothetical protein
METNKPKCDEVVRIASNLKSYPSIFDNAVLYNDNEYHSIIGENEEINVLSKTAGSTFANAYAELLSSLDEAV